MTDAEYRTALEAATREYEELSRRRAEIDARLAQLAQTMGTLTRLCGLTPTVPWGLTDACRMVLRAAGHPLTAMEVRAQLEALGFDVSRYANDLASIHVVLKRLNQSGEAQFVPRAWGKPAYRWTQPIAAIASSHEHAAELFASLGKRPLKKERRRK